jgi:hypothetical protein
MARNQSSREDSCQRRCDRLLAFVDAASAALSARLADAREMDRPREARIFDCAAFWLAEVHHV